jgi:hypothetical protein
VVVVLFLRESSYRAAVVVVRPEELEAMVHHLLVGLVSQE